MNNKSDSNEEKISTLLTEEHIQKRSKRASKSKFKNALKRVPNVEPDERDK